MPATQQLTITLPNETVEAVKLKVASGEFANESDVLNAGVLHLILDEVDQTQGMGDEAFTDWLRTEAVPVLEAMKADPSRGRTIEQVRVRLAEEHANFRKAG